MSRRTARSRPRIKRRLFTGATGSSDRSLSRSVARKPATTSAISWPAKTLTSGRRKRLHCSVTGQRHGSGLWRRHGGLDTLVYAGGSGENSPETRRRICEGLEFLGISLDARSNAASAPLISTEQDQVAVRVIRTDEELLIARAAAGFIP